MRIEKMTDECAAIRKALHAVDASENDRYQLHSIRKLEALTLSEFVDGKVMMGMPAHERLKRTQDDDPLWVHLGRLMAYDMLINNFDRIPLVWSNEGNFGNVMIDASQSIVVGIDQ